MPAFESDSLFLPPLRGQFPREGGVQQGGFAGFVGVEDGLDFFPGGIELRKEGFDARDKAVLLGKRGKGNNKIINIFLSYIVNISSFGDSPYIVSIVCRIKNHA